MYRIVGTCSICKGNVTVPDVFYSVVAPEPTCSKCGAVARKPVIDMQPTIDGVKTVTDYFFSVKKVEQEPNGVYKVVFGKWRTQ